MAQSKHFDEHEVLDRAVDLFWRKGYNATSANNLVDELGLSRSSIYDTYGDKKTLYLKSLKRYNTQIVREVIDLINNSINIKETIRNIFDSIIKQDICSKTPKGCFMVNSAIELSNLDIEVAKIVRQNQYEFENALEKAIIKGQQQGVISSQRDAKHLSLFLYNTIVGLRVSLKYNKTESSIEDIIQMSLSVLGN